VFLLIRWFVMDPYVRSDLTTCDALEEVTVRNRCKAVLAVTAMTFTAGPSGTPVTTGAGSSIAAAWLDEA